MPEGPEVKYVTDWLSNNYQNKKLTKIKINSGRYLRHKPPTNWELLKDYLPLKITKISCYGKFIWWEFDNNLTLWNTLGMSGWWNNDDDSVHNHITFEFGKKKLYFNDYRNFGTIIICTKDNLKKKLSSFGPNIFLDSQFNLFNERLNKKRKNTIIANALLDQKVLAGIGNYIRSDVLWLSKISPFRKIEDISLNERKKIYNNSYLIANRAYYILNNKKLPKNLLIKNILSSEFFIVYNQKLDPNGKDIIRDKIKDRTVHWVPSVQK